MAQDRARPLAIRAILVGWAPPTAGLAPVGGAHPTQIFKQTHLAG
jgi:hypothetical protein